VGVVKTRRPTRADGTAPFPNDFGWGVATAAYQIEGAAREQGRGPSVWDVFAKKPGAVFEGHTGDVACDHYHRYKEDVALMKTLGVSTYRFSISWSRVLPDGVGRINEQGIDFYNRLVDELLKNGIQPFCTLFHWDLPQALYERGGWTNRDSADWFADYAALMADKLSDRVRRWTTHNEPQCFIGMGLLDGTHAPGDKLGLPGFVGAAHNALRAHGKAVQSLRAHSRSRNGLEVGYVIAAQITQPMTERQEDIAAAEQAIFEVRDPNQWNNAWWTDPVLLGRYPEDGLAIFGKDLPAESQTSADLQAMKQPLDFLGLNIYTAHTYRRGADGRPEKMPVPAGHPRSAVDWQPIMPACLYWGPRFFHRRYALPLAITENGLSTRDQVSLDGKLHDVQRSDYVHRVLLELSRAIREGIPVKSYYHWSLLDNFEWADGYKQRFGLVYVDYATGRRFPKDSFEFYRQIIASNGRTLLGETALPPTKMTPA
jgi:beta-glucosidase